MKKNCIFILMFLFFSLATYSIDYENDFRRARELSWEKKYAEAELIYQELLKEQNSDEVTSAYANMLAWQGKYEKALEIVKKYMKDIDQGKLLEAKFKLWMGKEKESYEIYNELSKKGVSIGEQGEKFLENYIKKERAPKFELKYLYSSECGEDLAKESPELYFTYKRNENLTFVISRIWYMKEEEEIDGSTKKVVSKLYRTRDEGEIYIDSHHLFFGKSDIENFFIGEEFNWKYLTFGLTYNNYTGGPYRMAPMIQLLYPIKRLDSTLNQKITYNYVNENDKIKTDYSYMTEYEYREFLSYTQYYDFKDLNRGKLKLEIDKEKFFFGEIGLYRDYSKKISGCNFGLGIRF